MIIGVPREIKNNENRVSVTPMGVEQLERHGHTVLIERNAGAQSGFSNEMYASYGADILDTAEEVFENADMIVKVKEPQPVEIEMIRPDQIVFTYFHFAASEELTKGFIGSDAIGIAYETVTLQDGSLPLLVPMSEVAGRMAVQEGAKYLERRMGGKGVLLGGVPGVEPAVVTIIGGGVVGTNAAKIASGLGAKVYVLDVDLDRLRYLDDVMPKNVFTMYSNQHNIRKMLESTDLLVGAVLIPGAKAPRLVTRDMLGLMDNGSVIVDVAVDQGGCIETVKPTTHEDPIFEVDGVIHYCVANMPGAVPNTSTIALTNATAPYALEIANRGIDDILRNDPELRGGLNVYKGKVTHKGVAEAFDLEYVPVDEAIG
ncbi:MAG: alanine dehydrogenase [Candidatus Marinimicrobia bacterium]|nr:alanine dehydrogenase [Candidatus Neomarinimicrobiota bacterium]MCF7880632.1 alanine dehydrogenase [Candidatus Neomarinimicrobiota bacterium]